MRSLVPHPVSVKWREDSFLLTKASTIGPTDSKICDAVQHILAETTGFTLSTSNSADIEVTSETSLPPEGYRLNVEHGKVEIFAADLRGAIWAAQTLLQLADPEIFAAPFARESWKLQGGEIVDYPAFSWRGGLLDTARHFIPYSDLLVFLKWLSRHKINVFHWHLTDDQGWRFASDSYPRLAEVASWRPETVTDAWGGDHAPHGGLYTPSQIRAISRYANSLGIEVVPEINFPGHMTAALAAYPDLGASPKAADVSGSKGVHENVINFSRETLQFVHTIWDEILELTGAKYAHIGGDEVPTTQWENNAHVIDFARKHGYAPSKVQRWFTIYLTDWLKQRGVQPIGWDEVINGGRIEGLACQAWQSSQRGSKSTSLNMPTIMTPRAFTYFDYYQSKSMKEPYSMGSYLPLENAYSFDPLSTITEDKKHLVWGSQFQVWTEYIPDYRGVEYAAWPRGCAFSEVVWSGEKKASYAAFLSRLKKHLERLNASGVNYRPLEGPRPWQVGGGFRKRPNGELLEEEPCVSR